MNENTRFSELSAKLAEIGGRGVVEVIRDIEGHRAKKLHQDMAKVTSAKMIKNEFGHIKFSELSASEIQSRFNALYGSNTKPRATIISGFKETFLNQPVYFDRLDRVKFESNLETDILIKELDPAGTIPPGSLHWNLKKQKDRIYVKCSSPPCTPDGGKYEWVEFSEMTLSGFGKVKALDLITKFMENKPYNSSKYTQFSYRLL